MNKFYFMKECAKLVGCAVLWLNISFHKRKILFKFIRFLQQKIHKRITCVSMYLAVNRYEKIIQIHKSKYFYHKL